MLRWFVMFAVVTTMAAGCYSVRHIPIEQSATLKIAGKEVVVVKRPMPDFVAMTSGKVGAGAMFGAIGGAIAGASMVSAGNSLIHENGIPDPAYAIGEELARSMEVKYGTKYVGVGNSVIDDDETSAVASAYKTVPLALDVKTLHWGFGYFPTSWSKYRVIYNSRLRLIDTSTGNVIVEGGCVSNPEETDDAPTYDELVGNGANRLIVEIKKMVQYCVQRFSSKYLGM